MQWIAFQQRGTAGVTVRDAVLVLADGTTFEGEWLGADPGRPATGEVVFNTVLSGYQEVITDPSYAGQIITFTGAHIGNYGVNVDDFESRRPFCRGVVIRELARRRSSWRAAADLDELLVAYGIPGIAGVDTRKLTRRIREGGAMGGAMAPLDVAGEQALLTAARAEPGTEGVDLVAQVTTGSAYDVRAEGAEGEVRPDRPRVVAYDFGIKRTILRQLAQVADVTVVPASTSATDVLAHEPDGVFLSNGPGDPASVPYATEAIAELLGRVPVFGICLGHQLLARALGGTTVKLPFGHHGGNHPVRNLHDDRIEITSQNHNFAVDPASLEGRAEVTHVNLNDGVCEGIRALDALAFSVQHHPEAGPGPHDSAYLFGEFEALMADPEAWRAGQPRQRAWSGAGATGLQDPEHGAAGEAS